MFSSGGIELGKAVSAVIVNYIFDLPLIFVKICGLKNKKLQLPIDLRWWWCFCFLNVFFLMSGTEQ